MFSPILRTVTFIRKELSEILSQPRLLLGLIIGPFLVLLLVGLGYRNEPNEYRTLFVVPEGSPLASEVDHFGTSITPQIIYEGSTNDLAGALQLMRHGALDLVIEMPSRPAESVEQGQQATFTFYSATVDPFESSYIGYFSRVFAQEVNNWALQRMAEETQSDSLTAETSIERAQRTMEALERALEQGDRQRAQLYQSQLLADLVAVERFVAVGSLLGGAGQVSDDGQTRSTATQLDRIRSLTLSEEIPEEDSMMAQRADQVSEASEQLSQIQQSLDKFSSTPAALMVSPFSGEAQNISASEPNVTNFFVGPIISLLLQHLAVTFAALSLVMDKERGFMEQYRVSSLSFGELILGKYMAYLILSGLIAAILTAFSVFVLGTPILGYWLNYVAVIGALIFASVGIGMFLSLVSRSTNQAVQFSMLILLASVFLGGFFIEISDLWWPVRAIAWTLPTTSGVAMLHDVMLRGLPPATELLAGLTLMGVAAMAVNLILAQRRMQAQ